MHGRLVRSVKYQGPAATLRSKAPAAARTRHGAEHKSTSDDGPTAVVTGPLGQHIAAAACCVHQPPPWLAAVVMSLPSLKVLMNCSGTGCSTTSSAEGSAATSTRFNSEDFAVTTCSQQHGRNRDTRAALAYLKGEEQCQWTQCRNSPTQGATKLCHVAGTELACTGEAYPRQLDGMSNRLTTAARCCVPHLEVGVS